MTRGGEETSSFKDRLKRVVVVPNRRSIKIIE